ncbi:MAG: MoaD/ThiS family protein [Pseudomonadales bacterium]|nr:MoaD/ThiS family protein [Pseudomonadales bacterium]MDP6472937.1 MoaD/ThiS family protein [Pseudomonadales bacterium]MDP6826306.1 MoaD/ThiS family protein [Pseudomonadales bacterium]MDP6972777.1 MoaD/ThiS family protein [Pseudomonadales bacterium]
MHLLFFQNPADMARVTFPDNLLIHTGGIREAEVTAASYRDLIQALSERWPDLREPLMKSSVAIDGQIYQNAYLEPIGVDSDVFFMPRIEGG